MLVGLIVANIFKPGQGMNIDVSTLDASKIPGVDSGEKIGAVEFITKVIPDSLFGAITGHSILSALLVSLLALRTERHQSAQRPHHRTHRIAVTRGVQDRRLGHAPGADRHLRCPGVRGRQVAPTACSSLATSILLFTGTCVVYVVIILGLISRACGLNLLP